MNNSFLSVEKLSIRFGGLQALNQVSFQVDRGEIFAIIGPNGAGKTTIFNCINGAYRPEGGCIFFHGENLVGLTPYQVAQRGIARTFQNIELFRNMTVLDNVLLGTHLRRRPSILSQMLFTGKVRKQEFRDRKKAEEVLDLLELQAHRWSLISSLPYGIQKKVELARALAMDPELLLLDEPSAGMNLEESEDLSFWIEDIQAEMGITILLVEHDMRLVMQLADRITVLEYGRQVASGTPEEIQKDPKVINAYLGEDELVKT
jgi:branched-chain amino acid transport system ATP-binding protein